MNLRVVPHHLNGKRALKIGTVNCLRTVPDPVGQTQIPGACPRNPGHMSWIPRSALLIQLHVCPQDAHIVENYRGSLTTYQPNGGLPIYSLTGSLPT